MMSALLKKHNFDEVFDGQKMFRLILEAMSNPGRVVNIKEYTNKLFGDCAEFLAVAMTLLDNEVSFNADEMESFSNEIVSLTLAKQEKVELADFIFVCDLKDIRGVIESAKYGSLSDPHKSATVIIQNNGSPSCSLTLSGPGIKGHIKVQTSQTIEIAIALRDMQCYEYPQGIDFLFISDEGELLAIPRLTRMEVA